MASTGYKPSFDEEEGDNFHGGSSLDMRYGHDHQDGQDSDKPKIFLMGLRKSGKTSIQKVLFQKMSPNETLFLPPSTQIIKNDIATSSFVQFQVWDFPGQFDLNDQSFDADAVFGSCGALIYVIDAQDNYRESLTKFQQIVSKAYKVNPNIHFEVFIHKIDNLNDENKIEAQRAIKQQAEMELFDVKLDKVLDDIAYKLTSIYDHSIFENFSKVVQKLIRQLPALEQLLEIFISTSRMEKAFLIDVVSKIYIATDSSTVDLQTYELCSDMIDVVIDISCIYGMREDMEGLAYDPESQSIIKLNNGLILYLKEVNKYLALVCLLREEHFDKYGLINYNFSCFRKAIAELFATGPTPSSRQNSQQRI